MKCSESLTGVTARPRYATAYRVALSRARCLAAAVLVAFVVTIGFWRTRAHLRRQRALARLHARRRPMEPWEVAQCMNDLSGPTADPWLAVYGDSLTRGVFFDVATLLNTSSSGTGDQLDGYAHTHPGHGANYSEDCTIFETRPPLRRLKCGGFEYSAPLSTGGARDAYRTGRVVPSRWAAPRAERQLRMSYRLKTFTWEAAFDEPYLEWLRRSPRPLGLGVGAGSARQPSAQQSNPLPRQVAPAAGRAPPRLRRVGHAVPGGHTGGARGTRRHRGGHRGLQPLAAHLHRRASPRL